MTRFMSKNNGRLEIEISNPYTHTHIEREIKQLINNSLNSERERERERSLSLPHCNICVILVQVVKHVIVSYY